VPPTEFKNFKPGQTVKMAGASMMLFKVQFLTEQ
jgi:hypothetical protein